MPLDQAVTALQRFRAELSQAKQRDFLQAIQDLGDDPSKMTIAAISRAANVSRQFVYSHPHLHQAAKEAAKEARDTEVSSAHSDRRESEQGLRADRSTLLDRVERQRAQIAEQQERLKSFEVQRRRWLGSQLPNEKVIDPEVHAELHLTNERLMSDNGALTRKVVELRQLLDVSLADLAASREAYAEDFRRQSVEVPSILHLERARAKRK